MRRTSSMWRKGLLFLLNHLLVDRRTVLPFEANRNLVSPISAQVPLTVAWAKMQVAHADEVYVYE